MIDKILATITKDPSLTVLVMSIMLMQESTLFWQKALCIAFAMLALAQRNYSKVKRDSKETVVTTDKK